jgi:hypothetical protein
MLGAPSKAAAMMTKKAGVGMCARAPYHTLSCHCTHLHAHALTQIERNRHTYSLTHIHPPTPTHPPTHTDRHTHRRARSSATDIWDGCAGRGVSLKMRGTVLDLTQSPFTDFPELRLKEFPVCNLELERDHLKARGCS